MRRIVAAAAILAVLSGCSTIIEGTSQDISVNTEPPGADCMLNREGGMIARVNPTPGVANVKRTKYDITIVCKKDGYAEATYLNHSGIESQAAGAIVVGVFSLGLGLISWGVDSASGADNKYTSPVKITLQPETAKQ